MILITAAVAQAERVEVRNGLDAARAGETIEVKLKQTGPVVVRDADGVEVVSQMIGDDVVIFQAGFGPKETRTFSISPGAPAAVESKVFGRFVPERADDFAWENDRIAFRVYGPALETNRGDALTSSGVDVWSKRTDRLVINSWYKAGNYHSDAGEGGDFYKVGKGRGCGGIGIWSGNRLHVSRNYRTWRVLANGPIRVEFELTYEPWDAGGVLVGETRRIRLDAGAHLNRVLSTFTFQGADGATLAVGLSASKGFELLAEPEAGWLGVWSVADGKNNGHNATGIVFPPAAKVELAEADDNELLLAPVKSGEPVEYHVGAGWSKGGFADSAAWRAYLAGFAARLASPLWINVEEK